MRSKLSDFWLIDVYPFLFTLMIYFKDRFQLRQNKTWYKLNFKKSFADRLFRDFYPKIKHEAFAGADPKLIEHSGVLNSFAWFCFFVMIRLLVLFTDYDRI